MGFAYSKHGSWVCISTSGLVVTSSSLSFDNRCLSQMFSNPSLSNIAEIDDDRSMDDTLTMACGISLKTILEKHIRNAFIRRAVAGKILFRRCHEFIKSHGESHGT